MKTGPVPKPTALKLIEGNRNRRPLPQDEPKPPPGIPRRPLFLDPEACSEWDRIVPQLHAIGILADIDRAVLATYCRSWSRWVDAETALQAMAKLDPETKGLLVVTRDGDIKPNPLVRVANDAIKMVIRTAGEFGLSPSARTRIKSTLASVEGPVKADPADRFLAS
jgi:P27 family predicted phage terminase small subunit